MRIDDRRQEALVRAAFEAKRNLRSKKSWRRIVRDSSRSPETWRKLTSPVVEADGLIGWEEPTLIAVARELGLKDEVLVRIALYGSGRLADDDYVDPPSRRERDEAAKRAIASAETAAGLW